MLHTDPAFSAAVTKAVAGIEAHTSAEVVVVATRRAGAYGWVPVSAGALAAWVGLCFLLFSPWEFSGTWMPLELPLIGALVGWGVHLSPRLVHALVPRRLQVAQARRAAHAAFHEEVVHGTRERTGILIFVSVLEDQVVVVPDAGVDAVVPHGEWNALRWGEGKDRQAPGDLDHFLGGMAEVGKILAAHLPATRHDNPNQLPDAPRIRP